MSVDQALSFCQRIGGVTYVETSAKASARAAISAFEVAGLASMGKIAATKTSENDGLESNAVVNFDRNDKLQQQLTVKTTSKYNRNSMGPDSAESSLERKGHERLEGLRGDIYALEPAEQFWEQFNNSLVPSPKISRSISAPRTPSLGSAGLVFQMIIVISLIDCNIILHFLYLINTIIFLLFLTDLEQQA